MPPATRNGNAGLGNAAKTVAERASSIARLEARLAALELKQKAASLGVGIGLGVGAAILGFLALTFLLLSLAAGLATTMSVWAALLIVGGMLVLLTALLGYLALGQIRKATPPMPEQAITEAKLTTEALKSE